MFGFEWSGFQMVGAIAIAINKARPFENWTNGNPRFFSKCNGIRWPLFFYSHHNSQSLLIIFVHWTQEIQTSKMSNDSGF